MVDKIEKKNNIVIDLASLSPDVELSNLAQRINKEDVLELLKWFYAHKLGETISTKKYEDLIKLEWITELICIIEGTL